MTITVFTPAYNRAHTIMNLYNSLLRQTYKDFEWLVIDDGSKDNTGDLFCDIIAENKLSIKYYKVKNGGKHRAINKALDLAAGDIFFIVDSDDYLTDNALERINYWFGTIEPEKERGRFAGVSGLKGIPSGQPIGTTFHGAYKDARYTERTKYEILGDKAEAFYTDIIKKYRFPEFEGENFITEAVVWAEIGDNGYKLRYFNEVIYICEYLQDGLTKSSLLTRRKNIKGTLYAYSKLMRYEFPLSLKLRYLLNYFRFLFYKYIDLFADFLR